MTNLRAEPVEIDAIPVVEYTHPDALKQLTNADWVPQTMQSRIVAEPGGHKTLIQYPFMFRDLKINYFTASLPVASFESDRARFLGDHEYGTWAAPLALQRPELSDYETHRGDNIAALMLHLGVLQPGETRRVVTQLGQAPSYEAARPDIERYRDPVAVDAALAEIGRFWDRYLGQIVVETPDPALNSMLNIHNPRQCHITRNWSRYLSLYQLGYGARGIGFRDSSQDVMAVVGREPAESKALIAKLLHVQRRNGSAMHQLNPLTMAATVGDAREREDRPQYYGDDHLWSVLAVAAYLKETGDLAFLDESHPVLRKGSEGAAGRVGHGARSPAPGGRIHSQRPGSARPPAVGLRRLERHRQPADRSRIALHRQPLRHGAARDDRADAVIWAMWNRPSATRQLTRRWPSASTRSPGTANGSCATSTTTARRSARTPTCKARSTPTASRGR